MRIDRRLLLAILLSLGASGTLAAAGLDRATAADGLREALKAGASRAVETLGQVDGYLGNPEVRIPLPEGMESVGKGLRRIGLDEIVDEFETSMNRAAEVAAPLAREVFVDTIREISFEDALAIVRGSDRAATDYLQENSGPKLVELFRPIVADKLEAVGATRAFGELTNRVSNLPFLSTPDLELDRYVTDKALDGMFLLIAREEKRIREDPVARTSDLLKKVFGGADTDKKPWWKRMLGKED